MRGFQCSAKDWFAVSIGLSSYLRYHSRNQAAKERDDGRESEIQQEHGEKTEHCASCRETLNHQAGR